MENKVSRFVIVTHSLNECLKDGKLTELDLLVYASIRKYMRNDTRVCDSAISQIIEFSGLSKPTVINAIKKLHTNSFIEIIPRTGRSNWYRFPVSSEHFEQFLFTFLENPILTPQEKAFIIACRKFFLKSKDEYYITANNSEMAKWTGVSRQTVDNRVHSLKDKGMIKYTLTLRKSGNNDIGLLMNMEELGLILKKNQEDIEDLKETKADNQRVEALEQQVEELKKLLIK